MFNKENIILKNVFVLSFAAIISKILGAFYQAFLYRIVGPAGIALYMRGINIYTILLAISSAGIPIAISKLMADEISKGYFETARRIFKISLIILIFSGIMFSFLLFFLSSFLSKFIFDSPVTWVLQALAPSIFIVSIMGALRGFFQGQQNMIPTAYSQIIEQIIRIIFSVTITIFYLKTIKPTPIFTIVNGIALGPFIGAFFGMVLLIIYYFKEKDELKNFKKNDNNIKNKTIIKKIFLFAFPATIAALMPTLIDFSDVIIIPKILKKIGFSIEKADCLLGHFSGAVLTLINIITLIAASFSISLVPAIADAKGRNAINEIKRKTVFSTKLVLLISFPFCFAIYFLGKPILEIVFGSFDAIKILQYSILMILFISIYHSTTGILQGIGKVYIPLISLGIGLIFNIIFLNLFVNIKYINIFGAVFSHTISFFIAALINYFFCKQNIKFNMNWRKWIFQAIISSFLSVIIIYNIYLLINIILKIFIFKTIIINIICLSIAFFIGIIIYPIFLIFFKAINKKAITNIPKIGFIFTKLFRKF